MISLDCCGNTRCILWLLDNPHVSLVFPSCLSLSISSATCALQTAAIVHRFSCKPSSVPFLCPRQLSNQSSRSVTSLQTLEVVNGCVMLACLSELSGSMGLSVPSLPVHEQTTNAQPASPPRHLFAQTTPAVFSHSFSLLFSSPPLHSPLSLSSALCCLTSEHGKKVVQKVQKTKRTRLQLRSVLWTDKQHLRKPRQRFRRR